MTVFTVHCIVLFIVLLVHKVNYSLNILVLVRQPVVAFCDRHKSEKSPGDPLVDDCQGYE